MFTRYRQTNVGGVGIRAGVVRHARASRLLPGCVPLGRRVRRPLYVYMSHHGLLAIGATPARFRAFVARTAVRLMAHETPRGCVT